MEAKMDFTLKAFQMIFRGNRLQIFISILFYLLFFVDLKAQELIDLNSILISTFSDLNVKFHDEKSNKLKTLSYDIPLIEKLEFRTETNEFDLRKQEYLFRVSPNSRKSRKSHKSYHESIMHMTAMEYETEIMRSFFLRYKLILDFIYASQKLEVKSKQKIIIDDKVKLLKKSVSLSSFDIVELIEAEDEVLNIQRDILRLEKDKLNSLQIIKGIIGKGKTTPLIAIEHASVNEIKLIMKQLVAKTKMSHPELEVLSAKHYNNMLEFEWEAAQTKFSLGYVQAQYGYDPNDSFSKNFSIGFGFDIPIRGSSSLDLNEISIDILESQNNYLQRKKDLNYSSNATLNELQSLFVTYDFLKNQLDEGSADYAINEYIKLGMASPRALLKLKEITIKNELLAVELEENIARSYISYIYATGIIGQKPYRNYLHPELKIL